MRMRFAEEVSGTATLRRQKMTTVPQGTLFFMELVSGPFPPATLQSGMGDTTSGTSGATHGQFPHTHTHAHTQSRSKHCCSINT